MTISLRIALTSFAASVILGFDGPDALAQDKQPDAGTGSPPSTSVPAAPSTPAPAVTPADSLKIIDRKIGNGKEAGTGKAALVHYTGWLYDESAPDNKGKQFDTSMKREGLPFGFIVGVGKVIRGWDQGIVGMKVGGTRTLVIPASLAYGDKEVGNGLIPANSRLVFDIELVDVKP